MKKVSSADAELKKSVAYREKKGCTRMGLVTQSTQVRFRCDKGAFRTLFNFYNGAFLHLDVNHFLQKVPSLMFDKVLNMLVRLVEKEASSKRLFI